jgi:4-hydroxyphenylpyruvate dioxygenase
MRALGSRAFQPFRDFEGMPDQLRPRIFDRSRKFDVMQELGADLLLVCSNVSARFGPARLVNDSGSEKSREAQAPWVT